MAEPCNAQEAELEASLFAGADPEADFDREAGAQPSAWADEDEAAPGTGAVALWEDREGDAGTRCVLPSFMHMCWRWQLQNTGVPSAA